MDISPTRQFAYETVRLLHGQLVFLQSELPSRAEEQDADELDND